MKKKRYLRPSIKTQKIQSQFFRINRGFYDELDRLMIKQVLAYSNY